MLDPTERTAPWLAELLSPQQAEYQNEYLSVLHGISIFIYIYIKILSPD